MPSNTEISEAQLARLVGLPDAPVIIDVRTDEDFSSDPRLIPTALRRDFRSVEQWGPELREKPAIVVCHGGKKLSQGVAAWLRQMGAKAETLQGGFVAWRDGGNLLVNLAALPKPDAAGRTVWVTRARPKVDRIACPWLIRRFADSAAIFLYVDASEVMGVAERFGATPFDIEGVFWSHRGERCTFDTMIEEFGLGGDAALQRLALIVRAADTARLDLAPEASGLLAASLGLSRMYRDDLVQLEAGMALYDAFYRWSRDATGETHNWPSPEKS